MKEDTIVTETRHMANSPYPQLLVKVALENLLLNHSSFEEMNWITEQVAKKVFENVYPEMEKRILSDPKFQERIITDVLLKIADKISRMKLEKKAKKKK
jgi:hypothetical protein